MASLFQSKMAEVEKFRDKLLITKFKDPILPCVNFYPEKILDIKKAHKNRQENESKKEKVVEDLRKAKEKEMAMQNMLTLTTFMQCVIFLLAQKN